MEKQSVQNALLVLLLLGPTLGLAATVWRTVDYFARLNLPLHSVWFMLKAIVFAATLAIGVCVFRLIQAFGKLGYLTANSMGLLRAIGGCLLVIALANSAFSIWRDDVIMPKLTTLPAPGNLLSDFAFDFFVESPAVLLLGMVVFLLAAFVERALVVKSENEAFI